MSSCVPVQVHCLSLNLFFNYIPTSKKQKLEPHHYWPHGNFYSCTSKLSMNTISFNLSRRLRRSKEYFFDHSVPGLKSKIYYTESAVGIVHKLWIHNHMTLYTYICIRMYMHLCTHTHTLGKRIQYRVHTTVSHTVTST